MVIRYGFVVQQYPRGIKFSLFTNTCLRQERRGLLLFRFPLFMIPWWHFFENFRQKNLTLTLLYSGFVPDWRINAIWYNCVLEIWVIIDCALVIFTSRYNENILFERKHFRFLVVGDLSLKWAATIGFPSSAWFMVASRWSRCYWTSDQQTAEPTEPYIFVKEQ